MTREEENIKELKTRYLTMSQCLDKEELHKANEVLDMAIKAIEQKPILDKIFCIVHPLSIMSTPELEHKAIMQIAEMLEPLCLKESDIKRMALAVIDKYKGVEDGSN